ncbi:Alpha/Beta hydrolase protein [Mycena albidolilacea]|uniref:Alpha/Beta hydrolase protein n=1 Tax=Mycena albidolilacea TaxID=1033008 RepID=A0AAD7ED06_9AGAR|nr:Alpha/Beta hydrolase protein [Mycena albidolilacea]
MLHVTLPDGAQLGFEVLGAKHLGRTAPIVLIGGMSSLRGDWERLSKSLAHVRPGMGDSKLAADEHLTIELLTRDLLFLLEYLRWKELSICGFSMGGVITQQLLFLPYHPDRPTPLPFRVTHVLLTGTLCSQLRDPRYGVLIHPAPKRPLSEQEKLDLARLSLERAYDPKWLADPQNASRFNAFLPSMISGRRKFRPVRFNQTVRCLIFLQINRLDFTGLHEKLPRNIQFLVIHGDLDAIVPPYCGQEILQRIPWARPVEIGTQRGAVENLDFGHHWFEYFDVQVWHDVIEKFLASTYLARL